MRLCRKIHRDKLSIAWRCKLTESKKPSLFDKQKTHVNRMTPRPYQMDAVDAVDRYFRASKTNANPCIVLPTGAGKSPVMAWIIEKFKKEHKHFRCIVLAHRKELVQQNMEKMIHVWPDAPVGIYSASLGRRNKRADILFAGVDSVYNKSDQFRPFDLIVVDEAHRIPTRGEGKYRRFIDESKKTNPNIRVLGVTATPYRMGVGPICHRDHILNEIVYESNVKDLIDQGYLCPLRSKSSVNTPDLTGVKKRGGEYISKDLSDAVNRAEIVSDAVAEAINIINKEARKSAIFFCVDVAHCQAVSKELLTHNVIAPHITAITSKETRVEATSKFADGSIRAICNVDILTEGFDATRIDAVVLMRPTKSKGLYSQMVGRGLRLDPSKDDCLVLDFAGCIAEHGPIDLIDAGEVRTSTCPTCREVFSRAAGKCPECGWVVPKDNVGDLPAMEERQRSIHQKKASGLSILSDHPQTHIVDDVYVHLHKKPSSPDSLRVSYRCGIDLFNEWVCLDHDGYAGSIAKNWWWRRFGEPPPGVHEAMSDLFLPSKIKEITNSIVVVHDGKYYRVTGHDLTVKREYNFYKQGV